jgi:acyl dehydratase
MLYELLPRDDSPAMVVNYGVDRVRFPAPLSAGSRIRGRFRVSAAEVGQAGERVAIAATVERDGGGKPVCVADLVLLVVPQG